ncbi:adenosylmethionine--8-amino-7-oxononanoate transaminase [Sesbania bispinosa]|nr:adenosylmethionine--8-amino-7-oxononanoate transaminase [Sesbania bispinosa]
MAQPSSPPAASDLLHVANSFTPPRCRGSNQSLQAASCNSAALRVASSFHWYDCAAPRSWCLLHSLSHRRSTGPSVQSSSVKLCRCVFPSPFLPLCFDVQTTSSPLCKRSHAASCDQTFGPQGCVICKSTMVVGPAHVGCKIHHGTTVAGGG